MSATNKPTDLELAEQVAQLLDGRRIATAESCTAGRIAETLACVTGAVDFLAGGVVAYQEAIKRSVLGVAAESILSLECAQQMAIGAGRLMSADVTVSTTGVAGDTAEEGVAPGTIFIGVVVGGIASSRRHRFSGEPTEICDQGRRQALLDLLERLNQTL
jgi:PncC family amidohydrolase